MPTSMLWKSFNPFLSKFKCFPVTTSIHDHQHHHPLHHHKLVGDTSSIFRNFNSLYDANDYADYLDSQPDFSSALVSDRLFFSSPGTSNSITKPPQLPVVRSRVHTYSPDPCTDFKISMVEMIETIGVTNVGEDREILHELLLSYLKLNPKHAHKFIVRAFADVIVSLVAATTAS